MGYYSDEEVEDLRIQIEDLEAKIDLKEDKINDLETRVDELEEQNGSLENDVMYAEDQAEDSDKALENAEEVIAGLEALFKDLAGVGFQRGPIYANLGWEANDLATEEERRAYKKGYEDIISYIETTYSIDY